MFIAEIPDGRTHISFQGQCNTPFLTVIIF